MRLHTMGLSKAKNPRKSSYPMSINSKWKGYNYLKSMVVDNKAK